MPPESRLLLRAALLNLLAGLLLWNLAPRSPWPLWRAAAPAALHLLVVGWLTQTVFGVGHWLFPKSLHRPPRGRVWMMWLGGGLLNAGLLLRVPSEALVTIHGPGGAAGFVLVAAASFAWLGVLVLATHLWERVR